GLGRRGEPAVITKTVFLEVAEKAWQSQDPGSNPSAAALANATKAVFDAVRQFFEDRWQLLQSLEAAAAQGGDKGDPEAGEAAAAGAAAAVPGVAAGALQGALHVLAGRLERTLSLAPQTAAGEDGETSAAHARASRAVAVLAAYVDGFASLAGCNAMASSGSLWLQVCKGSDQSQVLPWALLVEVT
ncbi:unnamed protein product, partial [Prorocentrum cordatum]